MGGRAKVVEREAARRLRADGRTMPDIAAELGVARSSVSLWTRDVPVERGPRRVRRRGPNALERAKQAQIEELLEEGRRRIGRLDEREFLVAGAALYAGEGTKRGGTVGFANSDPRMVASTAHGSGTLSTSTNPGCACGCIYMKDSTWMLRQHIGRR